MVERYGDTGNGHGEPRRSIKPPSETLEGVIGGGIAIGLDFRVWGSMVLACRAMANRCGRGCRWTTWVIYTRERVNGRETG